MPFEDRHDAARRLAAALFSYVGRDPVVVALPRGGVIVAAEVARVLAAPLTTIAARRIALPGPGDLAMGAVAAADGDTDTPIVVRNEALVEASRVSPEVFAAALAEARAAMAGAGRPAAGDGLGLAGRVVIVVDEGVTTGAMATAALRALRRLRPAELVLAVPVAPADTIEALAREADRLVILQKPELFGAIGYFYRVFPAVSEVEAEAALSGAAPRRDTPTMH